MVPQKHCWLKTGGDMKQQDHPIREQVYGYIHLLCSGDDAHEIKYLLHLLEENKTSDFYKNVSNVKTLFIKTNEMFAGIRANSKQVHSPDDVTDQTAPVHRHSVLLPGGHTGMI